MMQVNPFVGSILQSTTVQRAQAAEKNSHVQRAQVRAKDSASTADQFEHQVESSAALTNIHDDAKHPQQRKRKPPHPKPPAPPSGSTDANDDTHDGSTHIDVKV